jgi:hypothetical protein
MARESSSERDDQRRETAIVRSIDRVLARFLAPRRRGRRGGSFSVFILARDVLQRQCHGEIHAAGSQRKGKNDGEMWRRKGKEEARVSRGSLGLGIKLRGDESSVVVVKVELREHSRVSLT